MPESTNDRAAKARLTAADQAAKGKPYTHIAFGKERGVPLTEASPETLLWGITTFSSINRYGTVVTALTSEVLRRLRKDT